MANISQRNEFELYDEKSKKERNASSTPETAKISSIEDPHFTDPEEGMLVYLINNGLFSDVAAWYVGWPAAFL